MVNLRRLLLATTLTLLASLAVAGSVAATPGNGAQVFDESGCQAVDSGTICFDIRAVGKVTETPRGNFLYRGRDESSYSFTGPDGSRDAVRQPRTSPTTTTWSGTE